MQLPSDSVWHVDGRKKKSKTEESGSYQTAQVGHGDGRKKKARLEKMVSTTQLRLTLETGRKKSKKWIGFNLD